MYRCYCGKYTENKFCADCGKEVKHKEVSKQDESPLTFNDYVKQKSKERVSKFKCKKKGRIDNREKFMTTIYVAFMKIVNGDMKQDRERFTTSCQGKCKLELP